MREKVVAPSCEEGADAISPSPDLLSSSQHKIVVGPNRAFIWCKAQQVGRENPTPARLLSPRIANRFLVIDCMCDLFALESYSRINARNQRVAQLEEKTDDPVTVFSTSHLSGGGLDLGGRALGTLLAHDTSSLTLGCLAGALGLLSLLSGLGSSLLLFALLDGLLAGSRARLRAHRSSLLNHIEGSTNDGTLGLDGSAGSLLGSLLYWVLATIFFHLHVVFCFFPFRMDGRFIVKSKWVSSGLSFGARVSSFVLGAVDIVPQ